MSNNALPTTVQLKKAFDIAKERLRHPPVPESSAQEKRQWAKKLFAELDDANALLEPARPSDPDTVDKAEKSLAKARSQLNDYIEQLKTLDPESEDSELDRDAVEAALVIDNGHDHSSGTRCARRSSRIKSKAVIDSASGQNEEMVVQKTSPKPSVPLPKNISVVGSRRARGSSRIKSKEFIDSDSDREEGMTGQQPPKSSIPKSFSVQRQTTVNEEPSKEQLPRESSSSMMKTTDSAAVDVKKTRLHELSDEIQIGDQRSTIVCQYVTPMTPGVDEDMVRHDALNPFILSPVQTAKLRSAYEGPREEELLGEPSEKGKMLDSVHGSIEKTLVELGDTIRTSDQRPTTVSPVVTPTPPRAVPSSGQNDWVVGQQPPESFVHSSAQTTKQLSASATCEVQRKEHVAGEPSKKRKTMDSAGGPATKTRFREPSDAVLRFDQ
ncbi:hypothetical protein BD410DRAFT_895051 [Rickenella mellea]|uniref:Uncharacterized protein n=1 Tax=Rickenella mellea TaxID=50990 RepID=A0A4Y7QHP5_9AGAM|nr:hypothetical protein BD410DRAFT_895051 [Rickenella mellea]